MATLHLASRKMALVGGVLAVLILGCLYAYWGPIWEILWGDNERLRNFVLIIVAALGLPVAIWRSCTAHLQAATAQRSLLNERYQRAAEMLGGKRVARLAGIYALSRMAERHLDYHILIMSALSAFVRTRAKREPEFERGSKGKELAEDVIAAVEALADRSGEQRIAEEIERYRLDLRGTDLRGLFIAEADLPRAILDDANLSDRDNKAVLGSANFAEASLLNASLASACIYEADFAGADLSFADLTGIDLFMSDFSSAILVGADFSNADFDDTVEIEDAILDNTVLVNVTGLTQRQLNLAKINPERPPILTGSSDPETGRPLVIPN